MAISQVAFRHDESINAGRSARLSNHRKPLGGNRRWDRWRRSRLRRRWAVVWYVPRRESEGDIQWRRRWRRRGRYGRLHGYLENVQGWRSRGRGWWWMNSMNGIRRSLWQ